MTRLTGTAAGVNWPPVFAEHAPLAALMLTLEQTQWLDADTLAARQGEQLGLLLRHHAKASPTLAARLAAAGSKDGDFASTSCLSALPVLTREDAQALGEAPCAPIPKLHEPVFAVQSSGSSGIPVNVRKTQMNQLMWMAMTLRFHQWAGAPSGKMATIRPASGLPDQSPDWGPPISFFHRTGPILRIAVDTPLTLQAERLSAFRPETLLAYPSNLLALREMGAAGRDALSSVRTFRTIGETLPPDLREALSEQARVIDCYSAEEVGYIAIQCPDGDHYHTMAETMIVEILDDAGAPCGSGEAGRVVVTDLHNLATPLIRYETGDYAVAGPPCRCGRGLPTIAAIKGRWRGMLTKPDGSRHWPLTGFKRFRSIAPIHQYQMIQHAPDRIEVRLAMEQPISPAQCDALTAMLHDQIDPGITFDIVTFADRLPTGPRGKTDEFISLTGVRA